MKFASFDNFLRERKESSGHKKAMELGLEYKGGGYWTDPKTGQITHQTVDGELMPYEGGKVTQADSGGPVDPANMSPKDMQGQGAGPQPAPGSGILGAPEPGTEQHPRGANWNPGPNGDNCVKDQPPPDDLSFDMFVGKTNYYKWVAGSDGSNYKNLDFKQFTQDEGDEKKAKAPKDFEEKINHSFFTFLGEDEGELGNGELAKKIKQKKAEMDRQEPANEPQDVPQDQQQEPVDMGNPTPAALGGMDPATKAKQQGLQGDGHGSWRDPSTGQIVARTVNGELVYFDQGAGGGVVSDGAGGDKMATSQPSWQNPTTGMLMVPPSQPESPEEIAAVPDAIPATPPSGYNKFIDQASRKRYADQQVFDKLETQKQETDDKYASVPLGRAFNLRMNQYIDQMVNSDDPEEKAIGNHMMDVMVDNADTNIKALEGIADDLKPGAIQSLARMAEREARLRYLNDMQEPTEDEPEVEEEESTSSQLEDMDDEIDQVDDPELQQVMDDQKAEIDAFEKEFDTTVDGYMDTLGPRKRKEVEKYMNDTRESFKNLPPERQKSYQTALSSAYTYTGRINSGGGKNDLGFVDVQNLNSSRERLLEGYGDGSPQVVQKFVKSVRKEKVDDAFLDSSFQTLPMALRKSLGKKGLVTTDDYKSDDKADKGIHYLGKDEDGNVIRGPLDKAENQEMRAKLMWRIYLEQGGVDAYTGQPLVLEAMDLEHVVGFNNSTNGDPTREDWENRENDNNFVMINSNVNQKKSDLSMSEFFESQVDPIKDNTEAQFGGVKSMRDKQNQIKTQNYERAKTLVGKKKGKSGYNEMTEETDPTTLKGYFQQDDDTHNGLRKEFREVAATDAERKKASAIKANMGSRMMKAMNMTRTTKDPSGRRNTELPENVFRGFLMSMAAAKGGDRAKYYKGWEIAVQIANESRSQKELVKSLKEQGLISDEVLNDKKLGKVFKEDYIWPYEAITINEFKSFSMFLRKLNT